MNSDYIIGIYLRLSKEDINKKDESNSIKNQRDIINSFINKNDEFKNCKIFEYIDDGFSGVDFNRPSIQKLFNDLKANKINCIVVKDLSRFGRNYIEVINYLENILPFLNTRFIAINDNFDSINSSYNLNNIDINFKNIIYDYYSKDLSKKVISAKITKAKQGNYLGSVAPFGYKKSKNEKGKLEIDEKTVHIIKMIFNLALEGKTNLEIARILNKNNIMTRRQFLNKEINYKVTSEKFKSLWTSNMIYKILSNKVYIGNLEYLKSSRSIATRRKSVTNSKDNWIVIENNHNPIISKEDFEKIQEQILKRKEKTESTRQKKNKIGKNIFAYKLFCGHCKYSLEHCKIIYKCRTSRYIYAEDCEKNIISKEKLNDIVLTSINKTIFELSNRNDDILKIKIKNYQKKLDKIIYNKESIYNLYLDNNINKSEYIKKQTELKNYEIEIKNILKNLEKEREDYKNLITLNKFANSNILTEKMIKCFINKIYVYDENRVVIQWKYDFKLLSI